MNEQPIVEEPGRKPGGAHARTRLLAGAPVTERRLDLAGVSTAVLEGGDGPPLLLLHGQGAWAGVWMTVIPDLVRTHRVIAPDLPGLGASVVPGGPPSVDTVMRWLGELIHETCAAPPVLVGFSLGGAIAARFAAAHGDRLASLVLVDAGNVAGRVRPAPAALLALIRQSARPSERTTLAMLRQVSSDLDRLRRRMGGSWEPFLAYSGHLSTTPSVRTANRRLLRDLGLPAVPPEDLARIRVPTTLIWGRHDRIKPVTQAEVVSARYGWPLHVIEDAGHIVPGDQPEAFLRALRAAVGPS